VYPATIFEDNQAAISIAKDHRLSTATKHMATRYFYVRQVVQEGKVKIVYIPTTDQLADIFTKPLDKQNFLRLRNKLGLRRIK
jgi:hypothetical protein